MISFALRWLWSFISPWAGRVITWAAPGLLPWLPGLSLGKIARGLCLVAALGGVAWLTWLVMRPDPSKGPVIAVSAVEAQRFRAENQSLKANLARAENTLREREEYASMAEQYIDTLKAEKDAIRAQSSNPDAPVFYADDPWLRQGR